MFYAYKNDNFIYFKEIIENTNNKITFKFIHFNLKMQKFRINGIIDSNYKNMM